MKKTLVLLFIILFAGTYFSNAQTKGFFVDLNVKGGYDLSNSDVRISDLSGNIGYRFNKILSLGITGGDQTIFFKGAGVNRYEKNSSLGAFVGVNLVNGRIYSLELVGSAASTLDSKPDWSYMYYDAGLKWYCAISKPLGFYVGGGYRYYNTYHTVFDSRSSIYAEVGFRFNFR